VKALGIRLADEKVNDEVPKRFFARQKLVSEFDHAAKVDDASAESSGCRKRKITRHVDPY
jgi:hypothetical protein